MTSKPQPTSSTKNALYIFLALGSVIAIIGLALLIASTRTIAELVVPEPAESTETLTRRDAQDALTEAERAMESVNLMLAFIQTGSIIIGALAAGATIVGVWNSRQLETRLKEVESFQQEFVDIRQTKTNIEEQTKRMAKTLEQIQQTSINLEQYSAQTTKIQDEIIPGINMTLLAQRQIAMNNLSEALETLQKAVEIYKDNPVINYLLGDTLVRQGFVEDGIEYLQTARNSMDDFYDADVSFAYAKRIQGDSKTGDEQHDIYLEAEQIFRKIAKERPMLQDISGESAFGALAGLYRRREDYDQAIEWYEKVRRTTPQNTYPINNLALIYFEMDKPAQAKPYFERARDMGKARYTLSAFDFWSRFDYITARLGLSLINEDETYPEDEMVNDLETVFEIVESVSFTPVPLHKFREGIERLNPENQQVDAMITLLTQKIESFAREDKPSFDEAP